MLALLEILTRTADYFAEKKVPQPRAQAEWILAEALGCRRLDLFLRFDQPMEEPVLAKLRPLVRRRAAREPLQYVLGSAPFLDLKLKCDRRALVPRPETEELVAGVVERARPAPAKALDLGTGTGAIALSLANAWPEAAVEGLDASAEALALAGENAAANKLEGRVSFAPSDWFAAAGESYGVIVSNPPYLTRAEWESAEPEVRDWEPYGALVADDGGFADLEKIVRGAFDRLLSGGLLALETGIAHHDRLASLAGDLGYTGIECVKDLSKRPRFFYARRP
ncbi:MAG TPA: peptide chain release factor N(5)-glutamine methyltransferase [Opitutales bacterium]|nr:peptide chain release factor N(5)-glutamine methyltransferase [Opitutales bacterium]